MLRSTLLAAPLALLPLLPASATAGEPGTVRHATKLAEGGAGLGFNLDFLDRFGKAVARVGDLDGDGVDELAVGADYDDDGGNNRGAVYVLFMQADGSVASHTKISDWNGGFDATLDDGDNFGTGLAPVGDLDGDGVPDLAVGASGDDDSGFNAGAVYVLRLNTDGSVKAWTKNTGAQASGLGSNALFGDALGTLGDLDGDGRDELAVGAETWNGFWGGVWILFLDADGLATSSVRIAANDGGFSGALASGDRFGSAVAGLGDLDGDGVPDLAVGAMRDKDGHDDGPGGFGAGAVWICFLDTDGTVQAQQKISPQAGGFGATLDKGDFFGRSLARLDDLDGDGRPELAVGANEDDGPSGNNAGAVYVLSLEDDGTVATHVKIDGSDPDFAGALSSGFGFGVGLAALGDLDGDGQADLAAGAWFDGDGALHLLQLDGARFKSLGFGLAGAGGEPTLTPDGDLAGGDPVSLTIGNAPPFTRAILIVSPTAVFAPAFDGTLVPNVLDPSHQVIDSMTDGLGLLVLGNTWPVGLPVGFTIYAQVWVEDPTAPLGWSATEGLQIIQPD